MRYQTAAILVFASIIVTSCKTGEKQTEEKGRKQGLEALKPTSKPATSAEAATIFAKAFLQTSDFKKSGLRKYSEAEISERIKAETRFALNPAANSTADAASTCAVLDESKMLIKASGDIAYYDYEIKNSNCTDQANTKYANINARHFVAIYCPSQDLSSWNGLAATNAKVALCTRGSKVLLNSVIEYDIVSNEIGSNTPQMTRVKTMIAKQSIDRQPCETVRDGERYLQNTCIELSSIAVSGRTQNTLDYSRLEKTGLSYQSPQDRFYASGTAKFTLNNISGKVNYHGPDAAPKWEAKLSGSTKTIGGSL